MNNLRLIFLTLFFLPFSLVAQQVLGDNLGNHNVTGSLSLNNHSINSARTVYSQGIIIGTVNFTNNNIIFEVKDSNKAIVLPAVTNIFDASSPSISSSNSINGMMAYDLASKSICVYQNSKWTAFASENLAEGQVYVGSVNNVATSRAISGDFTLASSGLTTISADAVKQNTFADKSITTLKLIDASISTGMLKNNVLTNDKFAALSVDVTKVIPGFPKQILTSKSATSADWVYLPQSFTVGDIKAIVTGFGTLPTGWVYCNGQVLSDTTSRLNGKTIPNLNGSNYLIGGSLAASGSSIGLSSINFTKANLPAVTLTGTLVGVSAGVPSGSIVVDNAVLPEHKHRYLDNFFSAVSNSWKDGGNSVDNHGSSASVTRVSPENGTHTHAAAFGGNILPVHTHTASVVLNSSQSLFSLQPKSYVLTYIMKVK